ncbi:hypothetical protein CH371_06495 [Leptospira wolffii]|uniref:Uncharacterized protein n=1 Tax=Leptospira wolffii TaxID=409998 RepID=A0A2M9ZGU3_9LEPT|nr:hypothetical protein CH371_06495 [Leptospira wolffii]
MIAKDPYSIIAENIIVFECSQNEGGIRIPPSHSPHNIESKFRNILKKSVTIPRSSGKESERPARSTCIRPGGSVE